jgi:hypothetical protein
VGEHDQGNIVTNAVIESATISVERGFILTSWVFLDYGDSTHQGFGGYVLGGIGDAKASQHHEQKNLCAEWIAGVMHAAEVENWSALAGRSIRVLRSKGGFGGDIIGIGHIVKDQRWFYPKQAFERLPASPSQEASDD